MNAPVITISTSATHLSMALHAFKKAASRDERVAAADKHKPYMLERDVEKMREAFRNYPQTTGD